MFRKHLMLAGAIAALSCATSTQAVDATVDWAKPYQTIEGMGFFGGMDVWWESGPFWSDAWGNMVIQDMGITMWRNEYYSDEGGQAGWWNDKQKATVQSIKAKADALGVPMKFIYSVWSPPSQWKDNRSLYNGGTLEAQYYDDYGNWLKQGVKDYADIGVQLYALSPANEPAFSQFFNSCVFTSDQYRDMIKIAGPIVHAAYPSVKIFGAEDMLANWAGGGYPGKLMADAASKAQMGALAVHGYSDGVHPTPASTAASLWSSAARNCASARINLWMTETSGEENTWAGAYGLGESIYAALKFGKITAWVYWYGLDNLATRTGITRKGYVSKHFFRYIRPGAVMYDVTDVSAQGLYAIAFGHTSERTMTVIVMNPGSATTLRLQGTTLPSQFTAYRSTSGEDCVNGGTVNASSIAVPANSILTLYATNFTVPGVGTVERAGVQAPGQRVGAATAFDLRGRKVNAGEVARSCHVRTGAHGQTLQVRSVH